MSLSSTGILYVSDSNSAAISLVDIHADAEVGRVPVLSDSPGPGIQQPTYCNCSPDTAPYTAAAQSVTSGTTTVRMYGAQASTRLNFALPDQAWSPALNCILWHAVKGARTPYPGPGAYGIPQPHLTRYAWGTLGRVADPMLVIQGSPLIRIVRARGG
jgi:hypothetical protein